MQIGSVNVVLTSTPKQFSGISLGMNLLIYLIGASVRPVIAGTSYASKPSIGRI